MNEQFLDGVWIAIDVNGDDVLDLNEFAELMKLVRERHTANMSEVWRHKTVECTQPCYY